MHKNQIITFLLPISRPSFIKTLKSIKSKEFDFNYNIILCFNNKKLYSEFLNINNYNFDLSNINHFYNNDNWGSSYYKLFKKSQNIPSEYIYYLEDDDILLSDFKFLSAGENIDWYFGNYKVHSKRKELNKNYTQDFINLKKINKKIFDIYDTPEKFYFFQLSQLIIKKEMLNYFPKDNNKYNDYFLFKNNFYKKHKIKFINEYFFSQGKTDDNIS